MTEPLGAERGLHRAHASASDASTHATLANEVSSAERGDGSTPEPTGEALRRLSDWLACHLSSTLALSLGEAVRGAVAEEGSRCSQELRLLRDEVCRQAARCCKNYSRSKHRRKRSRSRNKGTDQSESSFTSSDSSSEEGDDDGHSQLDEHAKLHTEAQKQNDTVRCARADSPSKQHRRVNFAVPHIETDSQGDGEISKPRASAASPPQSLSSVCASSRQTASPPRSGAVFTCPALPDLGDTKKPNSQSPTRISGERGGPAASRWARCSPKGRRVQNQNLLSVEKRLTHELFKARDLVARDEVRLGSVSPEDVAARPSGLGSEETRFAPVLPAQPRPPQPTPIQAMLTHPQLPQPDERLTLPLPESTLQGGITSKDANSQAKSDMTGRLLLAPVQTVSPRTAPQPDHESSPKNSVAESRNLTNIVRHAAPGSQPGSRSASEGNNSMVSDQIPGASNCANGRRQISYRSVPSLSVQRSHELAKVIRRDRAIAAGTTDSEQEMSNPDLPSQERGCRQLLWRIAFWSIHGVPCICGIIPWRTRFRWLDWAYQLFVVVIASLACCWFVAQLLIAFATGDENFPPVNLCMNLVIALAGLVPLVAFGGLWGSRAVSANAALLREYARREGFLPQYRELTCADMVCTFALWLCVVCAQVWTRGKEPATAGDLLAFVIATGLLAGVTTQILALCRALTKMVDNFVFNVAENPEFDVALQEWSLIQALCRTTCGSIQWPFLLLQAIGSLLSLLVITELRHGLARLPALLPGLAVFGSTVRIGFWAAAVTDKCARVPMLVNAIAVEGELLRDRMFVVDYIVHSRVGFYVFEVCLNTPTILQILYVSGAMTFGLASQWQSYSEG